MRAQRRIVWKIDRSPSVIPLSARSDGTMPQCLDDFLLPVALQLQSFESRK